MTEVACRANLPAPSGIVEVETETAPTAMVFVADADQATEVIDDGQMLRPGIGMACSPAVQMALRRARVLLRCRPGGGGRGFDIMRKTWLRLAMPSLSSIALATPHSVQQAQPCEITWVSLLLAMATAAVMRPFRMERLPARCLVLLLLLPTATTEAMAAYVTPHSRFDLISWHAWN